LFLKLPPLYPIIDFSCFAAKVDPVSAIVEYAEALIAAGATLIQLRDKSQSDFQNEGFQNSGFQNNVARRFLSCARELRRVTLDRAMLIVNDRVDLCLAADADGVHLGQSDLSPTAARKIFDSLLSHPIAQSLEKSQLLRERMGHPRIFDQVKDGKSRIIGFSTHNVDQLRDADTLPVDYIAIGPVFATGSKANPDPVVGLEGVRQARQATRKPLVAVGGITRQNCRQVQDAGADAVAVISDLLESPGKAVGDFLRVLG
jgi:thiamine-phosphate pyrophosphorylase